MIGEKGTVTFLFIPRRISLTCVCVSRIARSLDHLFAPETHFPDPTKTIRTSITLVWVGPVITRSPSGWK